MNQLDQRVLCFHHLVFHPQQSCDALAANVACSFGAALLFVLCNPWTGRPETRSAQGASSSLAGGAGAEGGADLANGLVPPQGAAANGHIPAPPSYDEAVKNNTESGCGAKDAKAKNKKKRVEFSDTYCDTYTYDDITFAYAAGFYDSHVPSSYYLSYTDQSTCPPRFSVLF